jgi:hypothetical protein
LRTDYRNSKKEALVESERKAELDALNAQHTAGSLTSSQYAKEVEKTNALYDSKIREILDYRVEKTYVLQKKQ